MQSSPVADHYSLSWVGIGWLFSRQQCWSCGIEGEGREMFRGGKPISVVVCSKDGEGEVARLAAEGS